MIGVAGIRFAPRGEESDKKAVRRHTTTDLTPEEIHQIGLDRIAALQPEWSQIGGRVLGETDVPSILRRLREDPSLRFTTSQEIVKVVRDALDRAESARNEWFPPYEIANCVIEEIHPIEAKSAALAFYRPPAEDGSRPGAHCVLTLNPSGRFTYEYEALAFPREHARPPSSDRHRTNSHESSALPTFPRRPSLWLRRRLGPLQRATGR